MDTSILFKGMTKRDGDWSKIATDLHKIKTQIKAAKLIESELEKELIELSLGVDSYDENGNTFKLVERKGSVDYKAIPRPDNFDLEPYRKAASIYWKFSIT